MKAPRQLLPRSATPAPAIIVHEARAVPLLCQGAVMDGWRDQHTVCPTCGAFFDGLAWTWSLPTSYALQRTCPACRRLSEKRPAGRLILEGPMTSEQQHTIDALLQRRDDRELQIHPMERIMEVRDQPGRIIVTTTSAMLARGLYVAVATTYKGTLQIYYDAQADCLNMHWTKWRDCCGLLRRRASLSNSHIG